VLGRVPAAGHGRAQCARDASGSRAHRRAQSNGLRVVRARAFNHAGPGQSDDYVVGTLTRQVAEAEAAGRDEAVLRTGNPDSARDFTDVRDVARAYVAAGSLDGGAYNVASGSAVTVRNLIELVRSASRLPVRHEVVPGAYPSRSNVGTG
jgi:GDP-4-dehydro-6-deoxy-D-mannose reductase